MDLKLQKIGKGALSLFLIPVVILIVVIVVPLAMVAILFFNVYSWVSLHWQFWRRGNRFYLIYSSRRGWNEFVVNNLAVALPAGVVPIWKERPASATGEMWKEKQLGFWANRTMTLLLRRGNGLKKPYLAEVTPFGIRARSLHEQLLPLKPFGRKNPEVQQRLHELLERELRG